MSNRERAETAAPESVAAEGRLREAEMDAAEESQKYVGLRANWWLDGAHWALARWRAALSGAETDPGLDVERLRDII